VEHRRQQRGELRGHGLPEGVNASAQSEGRSTIFHRFLDQERTPVCTSISLLTTVFVLFVMILVPSFTYRDWGAPAAYMFTWLVVVFGVVANKHRGSLRIGARRVPGRSDRSDRDCTVAGGRARSQCNPLASHKPDGAFQELGTPSCGTGSASKV
jgi:hypothetical protein